MILLVLGLSPLLAAIVGVIPLPVLGGAGIVLFGIVASSGIRTLSQVAYRDNNNLVLVAASVGFGLLPVVSPEFWSAFPEGIATIFDSGISSASIMAVTLNIFFNMLLPGVPEQPTGVAAGPPVLVREDERVSGVGIRP